MTGRISDVSIAGIKRRACVARRGSGDVVGDIGHRGRPLSQGSPRARGARQGRAQPRLTRTRGSPAPRRAPKLITTEFQVFPFFQVARLSKLCIRNSGCNCTFSYLHFESFVGNISYIRQKIRIKETKLCMRCNRNFKRQE